MSREWEYYHHLKKYLLSLSHLSTCTGGPGLELGWPWGPAGRIRLVQVWEHVLHFPPQLSLNISKGGIQWIDEDPELIWHPLISHSQWLQVGPSCGSDFVPTLSQQTMTMKSLWYNCLLCPFSSQIAYPSRSLSYLHFNDCGKYTTLWNKLRWANMNWKFTANGQKRTFELKSCLGIGLHNFGEFQWMLWWMVQTLSRKKGVIPPAAGSGDRFGPQLLALSQENWTYFPRSYSLVGVADVQLWSCKDWPVATVPCSVG